MDGRWDAGRAIERARRLSHALGFLLEEGGFIGLSLRVGTVPEYRAPTIWPGSLKSNRLGCRVAGDRLCGRMCEMPYAADVYRGELQPRVLRRAGAPILRFVNTRYWHRERNPAG